jgi:DNA-directed RNA polymerase specialized sigma24 family protein
MPAMSDRALVERLAAEPQEGRRLFLEAHTPTLLSILERSGVRSRDEAMEIYLRVCEHLAADGFARLRHWDSRKGTLAGWLTVVVRRAIVDWLRSRAGRRRLFRSIRALGPLDREVFELYYWRGCTPAEIVAILAVRTPHPSLSDVFDALERIEEALSARQRAELLSMAARVRDPVPLTGELERVPGSGHDPEDAFRAKEATNERADDRCFAPAGCGRNARGRGEPHRGTGRARRPWAQRASRSLRAPDHRRGAPPCWREPGGGGPRPGSSAAPTLHDKLRKYDAPCAPIRALARGRGATGSRRRGHAGTLGGQGRDVGRTDSTDLRAAAGIPRGRRSARRRPRAMTACVLDASLVAR